MEIVLVEKNGSTIMYIKYVYKNGEINRCSFFGPVDPRMLADAVNKFREHNHNGINPQHPISGQASIK